MSTTQIRASVLHNAKDLRIETRPLPPPSKNELQIRISATGLCGSDIHYFTHFRNGDILVREPLSLGHESAGVVVACGSAVTNFSPGDRVALEVGVPCGTCPRCNDGRYNLCSRMRFRSSAKGELPHFQGTLQEVINHPVERCWKLPDGMSVEVGALLEPLGVALHAVRRSNGVTGKRVVIFGAGAVGLLCAAVAKLKGARRVLVVDVDEGRLGFAVRNGFADGTYVVPRRRGGSVDEELEIARETAAAISKTSEDDDDGADVTFECTGAPACVQAGIYATRAGGRLMLVGMGHPVQTLPLGAAALREVDLIGVFRYADTYPESIKLVQEAAHEGMDLGLLVTHRFRGLEDVPKAFEMAGRSTDKEGGVVLKVVIVQSEEGKEEGKAFRNGLS